MNPSTGAFTVEVAPTYSRKSYKWQDGEIVENPSIVERVEITDPVIDVSYYRNNSEANIAYSGDELLVDLVEFNLFDEQDGPMAANTLSFDWGGKTYYDQDASLVTDYDFETGAVVSVGTIDYQTGAIVLNNWEQVGGAQTDLVITSGLVTKDAIFQQTLHFRTPGGPIRPQSFELTAINDQNELVSVSSDQIGNLTSATDGVEGYIDYETGYTTIDFGAYPVQPATLRYSAVMQTFLPLDAGIIGLDPVRLPSDGRVPIFRTGDVAVVHNEQQTEITSPTANDLIQLGRTRIADVVVRDAEKRIVPSDQWAADLNEGEITLAAVIDTSTYPAPWSIADRVEDMALISDVDISGSISLTRAVSHQYGPGSFISSAIVAGDLQARVANLFDQETWTGDFSDELIGDEPTSEFDDATYPIIVDNRSAIQQRWAMVFTGPTTFRIVGEATGDIGLGSTTSDISPLNPNTNEPYFTIKAEGWGGGWAGGNVLRFNTIGANFPIWLARTVTQSEPGGDSDQFRIQVRGNINA